MAKYRPIKTSFWDDDYILSLSSDEKLFFLYLITNTYTSLCGTYALSIGYTFRITGIPEKRIYQILEKFENDQKAIYRNGWIRMINVKKHQTSSPTILLGIQREESEIPQDIKESLYPTHTLPIPRHKLIPKLKLKLKPNGSIPALEEKPPDGLIGKKFIDPQKISERFDYDFEEIKLTVEEMNKLIIKFGDTLPAHLKEFENALGAKGYKYKSHYRAILKWFDKKQPVDKAITATPNPTAT